VTERLQFQRNILSGGAVLIVPLVGGRALTELVAEFESGFKDGQAGGYAGLVPQYFSFGDLSEYYLGRDDDQFPTQGEVWLLGCECGEVGCWPLAARVAVSDTSVVWSGFGQENLPERDYSGFGPFEFDRGQYDAAVRDAIVQLDHA